MKTLVFLTSLLSIPAFAETRTYICFQRDSSVTMSVDTSNLKNVTLETKIRGNLVFNLGEFNPEGSGVAGNNILINFKSGSAKKIQFIELIPGILFQLWISPNAEVVEAQNPGLKITSDMWPYQCR